MECGVLRLKWDKYKTSYFDFFKTLREKHNYTDATLAVEGKFYPVHKLVMSACSEYFSDIFERTACKSPVIVLKDIRNQDIEALLDYMYLGEVNVNQNEFEPLLEAAKCLKIKGLLLLNEDPAKLCKNTSSDYVDSRSDSPPQKRRREDSNIISSCAASSTLLPQQSVTSMENPIYNPSIPSHSTSNSSIIEQDESTIIKVEMGSDKEQVDNVNECEEGSNSDRDPGTDYGSDFFKIQHELEVKEKTGTNNDQDSQENCGLNYKTQHHSENHGNNSFPGPSLPQSESNRLHPGQHFPVTIGLESKGKNKWRECRFCNNQTVKPPKLQNMRRKKRSNIKCKLCNVSLCTIPCFNLYHSVEDYVNYQKRQNNLDLSKNMGTEDIDETDSEENEESELDESE